MPCPRSGSRTRAPGCVARARRVGGPEGLLRAKQAMARVARAISSFEPVTIAVRLEDGGAETWACANKIETFEVPIDDSWARDSGPTFVTDEDRGRPPSPGSSTPGATSISRIRTMPRSLRGSPAVERQDLFRADGAFEGGAIHVDGEGTLLTCEQTLLNVNRNPNLTQQEVEETLALYTGARKIVWLGEGFSDDETDGHVDNIACFAAPGRDRRRCRRRKHIPTTSLCGSHPAPA